MGTQSEIDFDAPPVCSQADRLPSDVLQVIGHLSLHCRGPQNASTALKIGHALGFDGSDPGRRVRRLISLYIAHFPFVVCGSPKSGFFVADDPEHLAHWERTQHALIRSVATHIHDFRVLASRLGYVRTGAGPHVTYERRTKGATS